LAAREVAIVASTGYVHGYSPRESERLNDQAATLAELLHHDTHYPPASRVLEAGCGVGAQTVHLVASSPEAWFAAMDRSEASLVAARQAIRDREADRVCFVRGDLFSMPWGRDTFDHVFVCFVLEHVPDPAGALRQVRRVLRPGGTLTVIEGDHGSALFHPDDIDARRAIQGLVETQARSGGDALVGRRLYPLLRESGFAQVRVSPRLVYADASRPDLVDGFTTKTFTAMVEGARASVLAQGIVDEASWERGITALRRTTQCDGTFSYCFFKATAVRPAP
jgi:SAM-dependent methyltransferase